MKMSMKLVAGLALCVLRRGDVYRLRLMESPGAPMALPLAKARYTLDPATPAWKLDPEKDAKLTWYVNAEWWNTGWGDDVVTKKVKAGHESRRGFP